MVQETVAALLSNKSHHHHHRHHPQNRVTSIPDELYNLTQLAEVASKLSTTNLQQIGSYLRRQDDSEDDDGIVIEDRSKHDTNTSDSNDSFRVHKLKSYWSKHERPVSLSSRPRYNGSSSSSSPHSRSSFVSVSEEDEDKASMYKYSHKIFDRKKARPKLLPLADQIERDEGESNVRDVGLIKSEDNLSPEDIHTCPECDKKYSTSSNLARHRQTHRSLEDKKARRCPHCDKVYVSMPAFSMHVRTHNQGCECAHCGKCFSRPWLLQGHIRTHTGEKPFKCSICSKAFADKSNLRAHVQTHSNTKPHSCNRCGKSFALKSYLYKHEESSCMKNNTRPRKDKPYPGIAVTEKAGLRALRKGPSKRDPSPNESSQSVMDFSLAESLLVNGELHGQLNRISVIRTQLLVEEPYQEQPVDFSAKRDSNRT